jgi:hypothetical protein
MGYSPGKPMIVTSGQWSRKSPPILHERHNVSLREGESGAHDPAGRFVHVCGYAPDAASASPQSFPLPRGSHRIAIGTVPEYSMMRMYACLSRDLSL